MTLGVGREGLLLSCFQLPQTLLFPVWFKDLPELKEFRLPPLNGKVGGKIDEYYAST